MKLSQMNKKQLAAVAKRYNIDINDEMTKEKLNESIVAALPNYKALPADPDDKTEEIIKQPAQVNRLGMTSMESAEKSDLPQAPPLVKPAIPDDAPHMVIEQTPAGEFVVKVRPFDHRRFAEGLDGAGKWKLLYEISGRGGQFKIHKRIYTRIRIVQVDINKYAGGVEITQKTPLQTEEI